MMTLVRQLSLDEIDRMIALSEELANDEDYDGPSVVMTSIGYVEVFSDNTITSHGWNHDLDQLRTEAERYADPADVHPFSDLPACYGDDLVFMLRMDDGFGTTLASGMGWYVEHGTPDHDAFIL